MAYNLPPPWDPGFAMPDNALAEGLERRAFVTKWMPRGTYFEPSSPNTSGYAIPDYVRDEPVGQGARVTDWAPRRSYFGPKIPDFLRQGRPRLLPARTQASRGGTQLAIAHPRVSGVGASRPYAMSGTDATAVGEQPFPEPYESYGQRAAAKLLNAVAQLPLAARKVQLRRALDAIDKTLWPRTAEIAKRLMRKGLPPPAALRAGLARAMSAGFIAELHRTGASGKYPSPTSQVGMGCYGCHGVLTALGAAGAARAGVNIALPSRVVVDPLTGIPLATGTCTSDGRLIWANGAWHVPAPSDSCVASIGQPSSAVFHIPNHPTYVGPFPLAGPGSGWRNPILNLIDPARLPADWRGWIADAVTSVETSSGNDTSWSGTCPDVSDASFYASAPGKTASGGHPLYPSNVWKGRDRAGNPTTFCQYDQDPNTYNFYTLCDWLEALRPGFANTWWTMSHSSKMGAMRSIFTSNPLVDGDVRDRKFPTYLVPIGKFNHPLDGTTWGIWFSLAQGGVSRQADARPGPWLTRGPASDTWYPGKWWPGMWDPQTDAPATTTCQIIIEPIPQSSWWDDLKDAIMWIPSLIGGLTSAIGAGIAGAVNAIGDAACQVLSDPTAAQGAAAAGGPAAGAGALIAGGLCSKPQPPSPPTPKKTDNTGLVIAGAAAVGVLLLLTAPKKKTAP